MCLLPESLRPPDFWGSEKGPASVSHHETGRRRMGREKADLPPVVSACGNSRCGAFTCNPRTQCLPGPPAESLALRPAPLGWALREERRSRRLSCSGTVR